MKERILEINPKCGSGSAQMLLSCRKMRTNLTFRPVFDYVVDAVDTVTAKIELIHAALKTCQVPIISCMGAGNKLDPTQFKVADIYKTKVCPLAKVMRREMKEAGREETESGILRRNCPPGP